MISRPESFKEGTILRKAFSTGKSPQHLAADPLGGPALPVIVPRRGMIVTQQQKLSRKCPFFFSYIMVLVTLSQGDLTYSFPGQGWGRQQEPGHPGGHSPHTEGSMTTSCPAEGQETRGWWETNGASRQNYFLWTSPAWGSGCFFFFAQGRQCGHSAWG